MGRGKRIIPVGMPDKLKAIRLKQNRTMEGMAQTLEKELEVLGYKDMSIQSGHISEYEQGKREPLLPVLLAYSKISNLDINVFVDNQIELPSKFLA